MRAAVIAVLFAAPGQFSLVLSFSYLGHSRDHFFLLFQPSGPPVASRSPCSFARRFRCISKRAPGGTRFSIVRALDNRNSTQKPLEFERANTRRTKNSRYRNSDGLIQRRSGIALVYSRVISLMIADSLTFFRSIESQRTLDIGRKRLIESEARRVKRRYVSNSTSYRTAS